MTGAFLELFDWLAGQGITLLPCEPRSKKVVAGLSTQALYGDRKEKPAGDSFHVPTPERVAKVQAYWHDRTVLAGLGPRDISASIDAHPGWHRDRPAVCIDADDDALLEDVLAAPLLAACPAVRAKKGAKLIAFLSSADGAPALTQYFAADEPHPKLEVFTAGKHFLVYGEHPDSTPDHPIAYAFLRGVGQPIPVLDWIDVQYAVAKVARAHGLAVRERVPVTPSAPHIRATGGSITDRLGLRCEDFLQPYKTVRAGDEIRGEHPVHGSTTGQNLAINTQKNSWCCYRCNSGGGPLEALAVAEGIIQCEAAGAGCLRDRETWRQVVDALKRRGYAIPDRDRETVPDDDAVPVETLAEKALRILKDADPVQEILDIFHEVHAGDDVGAKCLMVSLACQTVANCLGIHVMPTGGSGMGKSHMCKTMLRMVPPRFCVKGSMSNKALYYADDIGPGSALIFDDVTLSDDLQEILKQATSDFSERIVHRTVIKGQGSILDIPERIVWWLITVEGQGEDQVWNRMLCPWVDESEEQNRAVLAAIVKEQAKAAEAATDNSRMLLGQAIWGNIKASPVHVEIPWAEQIYWGAVGNNRREPGFFYDIIKSFARIRYLQRPHRITDAGVEVIAASREDFDDALTLYAELTKSGGGQLTKLTKREDAVLEEIRAIDGGRGAAFSVRDIMNFVGLSYGAVYNIMHGRKVGERSYTGLVEKCPAIKKVEVSKTVRVGDPSDHETQTVRETLYTFSIDAYRRWKIGIEISLPAGVGTDTPPGFEPPRGHGQTKSLTTHHGFTKNLVSGVSCPDSETNVPSTSTVQINNVLTKSREEREGGVPPRPHPHVSESLVSHEKNVSSERDISPKIKLEPVTGLQLFSESAVCVSESVKTESETDADAQTRLKGVLQPKNYRKFDVSIGTCSQCELRPARYQILDSPKTFLCERCFAAARRANVEASGAVS